MIKSAGEILVDEIGTVVTALQHCVTPIFDVNDKGEAELLGSAVLIEISGDIFLCTAKHVIDGNATSTLYIDGPSKFEVLEGEFYATDELDAAVLKLSPEQVTALRKYVALPSDHIAGPAEILAARYANLVGFPETKNRKVYQQNKIKGLIYSVGCMVIESKLEKVRVSFHRKRNLDATTKQRVKAPDPHGMSGGAMFGTPMDGAVIKGNPSTKLIAINTDLPPSSNEIFGPSIAIIVAIARDAWGTAIPPRLDAPNVKPRMSVARRSATNPE